MKANDIVGFKEYIQKAEYVVIDTNYEEDVLAKTIELTRGKIWIEPTGETSFRILKDELLRNVHYLSPNHYETTMLGEKLGWKGGNCDGLHIENCIGIAEMFFEKGVKTMIIKLGEHGVMIVEKRDGVTYHKKYPTFPISKIADTHGAGDSLSSATVTALQKGIPLEDAIYYGLAAAHLTLKCPNTIDEQITWKRLEEVVQVKMEELKQKQEL